MFAYVGCYTTPDRDGRGQGIAVYRVDPASGEWAHVQLLADIPNPSFLALDSQQRHLYCVHGGDSFSQVSAFSIEPASGRLRLLGSQPCGGHNPVALSVEPTDRLLVVANYADGTAASLPIREDGSLGPIADLVEVTGQTGPHPTEQTKPHPHHIPIDPAGRYFLLPDKGLDRVFVFGLDPATGTLTPADPPSVRSRPGAAPRHAAFHPTARYAYVINELDSTLTTYAYDPARGALRELQVLSTLPPDFAGRNTTAEIAVAPSGRFVYGSNRGHDSIVTFAVDPESGTLTPIGWEPTRGQQPRFFALDPAGAYLYVCNQRSDTIVAFRVDQPTGALSPTGQVIQTGSPVCIVFAESDAAS
jgi:6-phosphogluconolactonase (cycloisomerase 2 family)